MAENLVYHIKTGICSDWMEEEQLGALRNEMETYGDIMPIDIRGFEDSSKKVLGFLRSVALNVDAEFFFKVMRDENIAFLLLWCTIPIWIVSSRD